MEGDISGPRSRGSELPRILSEGISRSKGGVVNITKLTVPFTELPPEEMSLSGGKTQLLGYASGIIVTKKIKVYSVNTKRL